jgi:hypothetical protein
VAVGGRRRTVFAFLNTGSTTLSGTLILTAASPEEARARTTMVLDHAADLIKVSLESGLIIRGTGN